MKRKEKMLYTDRDMDFMPGETVTGRVADFELTERGNLRYVYVDVDDGRRTRVHLRSFEQGGLNTKNLCTGDELRLRKVCFIHEFQVTKWEIVSVPLAAHVAEAVRHLPRLLAINEDNEEDLTEYLNKQ